jgi:uncharacterized protein YegP (UPF0339 family)
MFYGIDYRIKLRCVNMADPKFEVYQDHKGEWRWRLRASNGKTIADSGEGYKEKSDCLHGIDLVKKEAPNAKIP